MGWIYRDNEFIGFTNRCTPLSKKIIKKEKPEEEWRMEQKYQSVTTNTSSYYSSHMHTTFCEI